MVFNRRPNYKRVEVERLQIVLDDIEEQEIDDEIDDGIVNESVE